MTTTKNGALARKNTKIMERAKTTSFADLLTESEIDKSAVVFAAKAITDKLQQMAESAAKMEANDIMPMLDSMRENFGPQVSQNFEKVTVGQLRDVTTKLRLAKDTIANEILRMEKAVNGEDTSDMAMDSLPDSDGTEAPDLGDMTPLANKDDAPSPNITNSAPELDLGDEEDEAGDNNGVEDISDLFHDDGSDAAAGRARKESFQPSGAKTLSEASDPDALILREFRTAMRKGRTAPDAATEVAARFGIDFDGVFEVVREAFAAQTAPEASRVFVCKDKTKAERILSDAVATYGIKFRMTANGASVSGSKRDIERLDSQLRGC